MEQKNNDIGNFELSETFSDRTIIYIDSNRIDECLNYYRQHHIDGVGINPWSKTPFKGNSLAFLEKIPELRALAIQNAKKFDTTPLMTLKKLQYLSIGEDEFFFDFSGFTELEELRTFWHKKSVFPAIMHYMKRLYLWKFKSPTKTCMELPECPELDTLELIQGNFTSLKGIERYKKLKHVEIYYCPKMTDISALTLLPDLEFLHIGNCSNILNHEITAKIKTLRVLRLCDCGKMQTIKFIEQLPQIEDFRFVGTNVEDGDMTPCFKLKSVGYDNKRHYSHKDYDVRKAIGDPFKPFLSK